MGMDDATRASWSQTPKDPPRASDPTENHGPQFFGALKGQLSVSPSGAASYSVPIAIPPGVAGMAPHLSLDYTRQCGTGNAGEGLGLAGPSMIHPCQYERAVEGWRHPPTA